MKNKRRLILFALLVAVIAGWIGLLWIETLYEIPENYSLIEDGLYMGGDTEKPPPGTHAVLNLCEKEDPYQCDVHVWEPIRDAAPAPNIDWLKKKVDWVEMHHGAGKTTYVHCFQGRSRSGLVVTAYMMQKYGWTRDEAITNLQVKRPQLKPNPAFMELLREWEQKREVSEKNRTSVKWTAPAHE